MVGSTPVTMTTATVETVTPSVIAEMNRHIESKYLLHCTCTCSQAKYCSQKNKRFMKFPGNHCLILVLY